MSNDIDGHRLANENEPTCKICASFNNCKDVCDSIDTSIYFTTINHKCRYLIDKYKMMKEMFKVL